MVRSLRGPRPFRSCEGLDSMPPRDVPGARHRARSCQRRSVAWALLRFRSCGQAPACVAVATLAGLQCMRPVSNGGGLHTARAYCGGRRSGPNASKCMTGCEMPAAPCFTGGARVLNRRKEPASTRPAALRTVMMAPSQLRLSPRPRGRGWPARVRPRAESSSRRSEEMAHSQPMRRLAGTCPTACAAPVNPNHAR